MVMGQIALCLVMLFSAGMFLRAAIKEGRTGAATGFSTDGVAIAQLDFSLARTAAPEAMSRALAAVEQLRRVPAVKSVAVTSLVPYNSSITTTSLLAAEAPVNNTRDAPVTGTVGITSTALQ